ncbi:unnamed protein product [Vitrella brassicaformis CCMP3155]|uniref:Uncharacterized protein n=1 Tax=Vitrella brassicaformis (strain CCMP3155) TaxID=1169540 RepID=A0A0G4ERT9_VITBC|nr:unnamed protein product [Vitrella brassicaformis CCMP3155]|eukprot:CEM00930.1 unnamed protein product [Vitrella brassicaformis CCMP3155]
MLSSPRISVPSGFSGRSLLSIGKWITRARALSRRCAGNGRLTSIIKKKPYLRETTTSPYTKSSPIFAPLDWLAHETGPSSSNADEDVGSSRHQP